MTAGILWSHDARFAPAAISASEARAFVSLHLTQHELAYLIDDIRLVVSELVTNAVVHARTPLTVTIQEQPRCVLVTVHDGAAALPATKAADVGATGGRGLDVVGQCSSDWGVTPGTGGDKSVWASFALSSTSRTPEPATSA